MKASTRHFNASGPRNGTGSFPLARGRLWRAWVVANAAGEWVGLAIPTTVGIVLAHEPGLTSTRPGLTAMAMVLAGTLEGTVVGISQWLMIRRVIPAILAWAWIKWTALGAAIAWTLGVIPSLLMHEAVSGGADVGQLSDLMQFGLAAAMGSLLGPVLAFPQWLVLRHHVAKGVVVDSSERGRLGLRHADRFLCGRLSRPGHVRSVARHDR
jgi:hypothetical protein